MSRDDIIAAIARSQRKEVRFNKDTQQPFFTLADCISRVTY